MTGRNGSENPFGGVNPGRYGSGWGRPGTEGRSCLHVPRRLDNDGKARFDNNNWRVCVRTFVFRGGPELGQLGSVRPIKVRLQMKGWAVRPWLCRSSGRGAPKNEDIVFSGVGAREGVSNG
jgi:hypothetical protein